MPKPKGEGIPIIADSITLEPVTLALVGYAQLHRMLSLEAQGLFINGYLPSYNPHLPHLLVQFVKERLDFPQWLFGGLCLRIFAEVIETQKSAEMLPSSKSLNHFSTRKDFVHGGSDVVVPKQPVLRCCDKPKVDGWLWR